MAKQFDPRTRMLINVPEQPIYIQRGYAGLKSRIEALERNPGGSSNFSIPEVTVDPTNPQPGDAWIKKTTSGGAGGGKLKYLIGLSAPITSRGAATTIYQFCYRTTENTTIRVAMA